MKKILKILLKVFIAILIVLVIGFVALLFYIGGGNLGTGWDNFYAAVKGLTTSTEEIEKEIEDNRKQQVEILKEYGFDVSYEMLEKMDSGEMSVEDVEKLFGIVEKPLEIPTDDKLENEDDASAENNDENVNNDEIVGDDENTDVTEQEAVDSSDEKEQKPPSQSDEPKEEVADAFPSTDTLEKTEDDKSVPDEETTEKNPDTTDKKDYEVTDKKDYEVTDKKDAETTDKDDSTSDDVDEQISKYVATMYVYKSQYTGLISSIVSTMYYQFYGLPKDQQVYSNKVAIYNQYAGQIASMEAQCDAQVYALIDELIAYLKANGRDVSLADALLTSYNTEKENSKAYHISRYAD